MRLCVLVLAALGLSACASSAARSAAEGRAAAERDIEAGTPWILETGRFGPDTSPFDPESGLPRESVGCLVDDATRAYVEAHNDAILAALRAGRLQGMTLGDRHTTAEALAARFQKDGGIEVALGIPPIAAPGDRFRVEVAPRNNHRDMQPCLFVADAQHGTRAELYAFGYSKTRVLFDHDGRTLLVRDDDRRTFRTFDLARALELQAFPGD